MLLTSIHEASTRQDVRPKVQSDFMGTEQTLPSYVTSLSA